MSETKVGSPDAAPFLAAVLAVNGVLCILGALSDHSTAVVVVYVLLAPLNFFGSWKVSSDWRRRRRDG